MMKKERKIDLTGDHPPPKRAMTAWTFFNAEMSRKYYAEGRGKEAFALTAEDWKNADE